ncbi:MAG: glycerophosphodiester phosphodiesterase family protein, partial [Gemmatimonadaceae bacterium]
GRGIQVPTLDEALESFPGVPCVIELKSPEATEPFVSAVERHGAKGRVLVGSFSEVVHAQLEGRGFHITASKPAITRLFFRSFTPLGAGTVTYQACSVPPTWKHLRLPVRRFARMLRKRGIPTHCWTINDPRVARRLWDGGVNAILSDDPGTMLALLGRAPGASPPAESR